MSMWDLYWITRLDAITGAGIAILVLSIALIIFGFLVTAAISEHKPDSAVKEYTRRYVKFVSYCCLGVLFSGAIIVFVPTTKEMAVIYVVPKIVNNKKLQEESSEIYTLTKTWLKQQIMDEDNDKDSDTNNEN